MVTALQRYCQELQRNGYIAIELDNDTMYKVKRHQFEYIQESLRTQEWIEVVTIQDLTALIRVEAISNVCYVTPEFAEMQWEDFNECAIKGD
jgi:hypothetical protein